MKKKAVIGGRREEHCNDDLDEDSQYGARDLNLNNVQNPN